MSSLRGFLLLFALQLVNYTLLCVNYRAVAHADYLQASVSDFLIASLSFFVIKKIATDESKNVYLWLGYALGGVAGSITGIWLSKILLNS